MPSVLHKAIKDIKSFSWALGVQECIVADASLGTDNRSSESNVLEEVSFSYPISCGS